jgi:hypothetical protein
VVYGNPETTTGGNALKFYASVRLDIRKVGVVKNGEQAIGNKTRAKVVKNKVAPPFRECELEILYGSCVSAAGDVVDLASDAGLLEKSGAYCGPSWWRSARPRTRAWARRWPWPPVRAWRRSATASAGNRPKATGALVQAAAPAAYPRSGFPSRASVASLATLG